MASFLSIVTALFGLLFSYIIIGGIVNYRKLSQFKGPPLAGFSRAWMLWQSLNARVNRAEFEAIHKYGDCPMCCDRKETLLITYLKDRSAASDRTF